MKVLGIESSCDETSVSILENEKVISNLISSQAFHVEYGGVVPELSSRAHLQMVAPLLKDALKEAQIGIKDIDLICSTAGPGLIGALLVGLTFAKGLSFSLNKPFIPVNHVEGHTFSGFLMDNKPEFPFLCLAVSGGHTLLLLVKGDAEIVKLGTTIDDAAGEAFDKTAKMLGFKYPGGPMISEAAAKVISTDIHFPVARCKNEFDFSFSGLKTSVLRFIQKEYDSKENIPEEVKNQIAHAFQDALIDALMRNVNKALNQFKVKSISLVGGVAANLSLRNEFQNVSSKKKIPLVIPSFEYCSDNAAMIALRGFRIFKSGQKFDYNFNAYASLSTDNFINYHK